MEIKDILKKANLEVFSETLQFLAEKDKNIMVVTSDSRGSGKLVPFGQKFPEQIVEVGIAEQNLVGVAAGLASMDKKTFAVSPACFLTARSLEQIKNDVCYSDNAVKLIGISAGVSYGALGSTHHSLHDFAVLRAINNISIVAPADNYETREVIKQATEFQMPIYIRFGKKAMPTDLKNIGQNELVSNENFQIGKGRVIRNGSDLTFIATGEAVLPCVETAKILQDKHQISCKIISMHTIKPLDTDLVLATASNEKPIITVEEHSINGGLGEAVAALLFQNGCRNKFKIIGLPDEHTVSGSQNEIFDHYGISSNGLEKTVLNMLNP
ncbi:Apulose-4-phosphate transketolase subunit B [Emticicia aquatica]|uniref:Apulose-4-phosphate transketolase subunit B n=1 Tax=Emticicia aquatica TaxID=1681835 RepID=A0ABM9AW89_9BACT|nr:transketolase C-terminal domain-containing protein [Emticicia aquatica]CAH0997714.1 Apulose-4-phosphate transketolase subunit B [Emticicia aquatica]